MITLTKRLSFIILVVIIGFCDSEYSKNNAFEKKKSFLNQKQYKLDEEINEIEIQLLHLLGFTKRPIRTHKYPSLRNSAPKYLMNIFESLNNEERIAQDDKNSRKTRNALNFITDLDEMEFEKSNNIITFVGKNIPIEIKSSENHEFRVWFNINQIPKDFTLIRSELRIFQDPSLGIYSHTKWSFTVIAYKILMNNQLEILSSVNTSAIYRGWLEIDVTDAFQNWLAKPTENFGILIKVEINGHVLLPQNIGLIDLNGDEQMKPFTVGFFNGPEIMTKIKKVRTKRDTLSKNVSRMNSSENFENRKYFSMNFEDFQAPKICQRMNFSVNFKELHWNDWIIAPEKFDAFFCSGECNFPLGAGMNATNHALVQTLMHLKQPSLPKPCCAPVSLGSIAVLYYLNEESVNLRKYRHMIVKSCGCH